MNKSYLRYFLLILGLVLSYQKTLTQTPTIWYNSDFTPWSSPMSGGFLAPQFSNFDFDMDGIRELISFDRFSGIIQVWTPEGNDITYRIRDDIKIEWPVVQSWMQVRDYNHDQIPDLFTQGLHGIAVYKGIIAGSKIRFIKATGDSFIDDSLIFHNKSGGTTNIYHAASDIPIIEDVDGDGDLDIMTFELSGSYLYYYENKWDNTGKELDFSLRHNCWGYFAENQFSDGINLAENRLNCPPPFSIRHSGSTSSLLDVNHDSVPDLLLGDIGGKSLKILINHGKEDTGFIAKVNPVFPDEESPAILHYFPAAFKLDINEDHIDDVVVAVNDYPLTDFEGIWAFTGTGDTTQPFIFQTDHWLSEQYMDFGQYSTPYFMKVNGDALKDLFISYQVTENANKPLNRIAYFEALSEKEFQLRTLDFGGLSEKLTNGYRPYLTAGDVDNDQDQDILVGMSNGTCYLISNSSDEQNTFEIDKIEEKWVGLELLSGATPELYDIDEDGDLDVLAGSDNGTIVLYVNTGEKSKAVFDPDPNHFPNIKKVGQIQTIGGNSLLGRSAPRIFKNGKDTILISGSHEGKLYTFRVNKKDLSSEFDQIQLEGWPEWTGSNARITIDSSPVGQSRLLTGNIAGGLQEHLVSLVMTNGYEPVQYNVEVFPNPIISGHKMNLSMDQAVKVKRINVIFPNGVVFCSVNNVENNFQLPTLDWIPGLYFVQMILHDNSTVVRKVIVQ